MWSLTLMEMDYSRGYLVVSMIPAQAVQQSLLKWPGYFRLRTDEVRGGSDVFFPKSCNNRKFHLII